MGTIGTLRTDETIGTMENGKNFHKNFDKIREMSTGTMRKTTGRMVKVDIHLQEL